jgi:hypothetical protein
MLRSDPCLLLDGCIFNVYGTQTWALTPTDSILSNACDRSGHLADCGLRIGDWRIFNPQITQITQITQKFLAQGSKLKANSYLKIRKIH